MEGALAGVKDCPWDSSLSSGAEQNLIYFHSDEAVNYFDEQYSRVSTLHLFSQNVTCTHVRIHKRQSEQISFATVVVLV